MTRSWLPAVALVAGATLMLAAVAFAQPATPPASSDNAAPSMSANEHPQPDEGWREHGSGWGFRHMNPKEICGERYAREAGFLAYLGAKLDLTPQQQPLWDKYQQGMLTNFAKLRDICVANRGSTHWDETALQRRDRMEKMLTAKLDVLRATRPALDALYQTLSPEQRAVVNHPRRRHWRH